MTQDAKAIEAAHVAYERFGQGGDLRTRRLSDECMSAIIAAYLSALRDGEAIEAEIDRIAECMWQAEWKRAGNGGLRKIPWSEVAPVDQERFRFVAREVAALRNAEPAASDETAWLIERISEPMWWSLHYEPEPDWTRDANKAVRFARKEDADDYINDIGWTDAVATEHMWPAHRPHDWFEFKGMKCCRTCGNVWNETSDTRSCR